MPQQDFVKLINATARELVARLEWPIRLMQGHIEGVEVTQAIQYYHSADHFTDANDRRGNNSAGLIANKLAWVRVYVGAGFFRSVAGQTLAGFTGTLTLERRRAGRFFTTLTTLAAQPPGTVAAQSNIDYASQRGSTANSLNFIIPADLFEGTLRLTATLRDASGTVVDTHRVFASATLRQTLRIRGIMVAYNGASTANPAPGTNAPNLTLAAPSLANLQTTAALALRAMPVQATGSFASAGTVTCTRPLDDARTSPGSCSPNWGTLLTALTTARTNDGNRADVVYYGLLPTGIPLGVPGCGQGGLGSGGTGDQATFLHEIGHGYGFAHTPCGNVGTPDPSYPVYEPYASGSIGEYGLDISNGNVFSPQTTRDYMSYCSPQWMSLYQHARLYGHARLDPRPIREQSWLDDYIFERPFQIPEYWLPDPPPDEIWRLADMVQRRVVSVIGEVRAGKVVAIHSVARVLAAGTPPGRSTGLTAALLDGNGGLLAEAALHRLERHGACGCNDSGHDDDEGAASSYSFQAFIPDLGTGSVLCIRDGDTELWQRSAPKYPPRVGKLSAKVGKDAQLSLRWVVEADSPELEAWAQWSRDDGKLWHGLATGLHGGRASLALTGVADGPVLVRVLVHDGFHSTASEPVLVKLPARAPEVAILYPAPGQRIDAGRSLQLWAAVTDAAGLPQEARCCWQLDGKPVGEGRELWLQAPAAGRHQACLSVHWQGGEVERSVEFVTLDAERPDYQPHAS